MAFSSEILYPKHYHKVSPFNTLDTSLRFLILILGCSFYGSHPYGTRCSVSLCPASLCHNILFSSGTRKGSGRCQSLVNGYAPPDYSLHSYNTHLNGGWTGTYGSTGWTAPPPFGGFGTAPAILPFGMGAAALSLASTGFGSQGNQQVYARIWHGRVVQLACICDSVAHLRLAC